MSGPPRAGIACVMLSRGHGGLEQSMLDYCEALTMQHHRVVAVTHPNWLDLDALAQLPVERATCRSLGEWDPLATRRLRRTLGKADASIVVTIGRRATALARRALASLPELAHCAVTPNYSLKHLIGLDHVFATTHDLEQALVEAGQPGDRISVIPNMVRVPADAAAVSPTRVAEPTIGALGRFVPKKGFSQLIDALALLRERGYRFRARFAGDGPEARGLCARAAERGLAGDVDFPGWITDKRAFFDALDVFCVPSLHEPFGIVVLEGFAHGRPTVVTDAEGPREIAADGSDALIVPRDDPVRLADALARLLDDPGLRHRLATAALATVRERYELSVVAVRLSETLRRLVGARRAQAELARACS